MFSHLEAAGGDPGPSKGVLALVLRLKTRRFTNAFTSGLSFRTGSILLCSLGVITVLSPAQPKDTLELPSARAENRAPHHPMAAKTEIILTDADRQVGNLGDMLQRAGGLHVVRSGGLGDYLGVSIQGASENQVNVYVNGVLKNQANDPSLFLGDWDLSRIDRIEVYKGLAPDHLPGSPMGGSINIITQEAKTGTSARGALGAGSFGTLRANGSVNHSRPKWRGHFEAARNQSEGDFPYYDDNGTEFEPGRHPGGAPRKKASDLTRKIRRNNGHALSQVAGDIRFFPFSGLETGAQIDASQLRKEIPAVGANIDSTVTVSAARDSERLFFRSFAKWSGAKSEVEFSLSGSWLGEAYVDTSKSGGNIGLGYDRDRNTYTDGLSTLWGRSRITDKIALSALASFGVSSYLFTDELLNKDYPHLFRYTGDVKLTPSYTTGRHSLQAMLAATFTLQEQYGEREYTYGGFPVPKQQWGDHESIRLGYQYQVRPGLRVSAQVGNAYRIPTFMEQFGDRGTLVANPALKPEAGVNGSVGVNFESTKYSAALQTFASEGRRIISLQQNSQSILIYRNSSATHIFGVETRLMAAPRSWTRTELDITLQKAVNATGGGRVGDGKIIPYRPLSQASLRQKFMRGGWTWAGTQYYQGQTFPNPSNQASLFDSYSRTTQWQSRSDVEVAWRRKHLLLFAGIQNVFDQNNFDFFNFPHPGRNFTATAQVEL